MALTPTVIPAPAVFPFDPDGGFAMIERVIWLTDVMTGRNGRETRVQLPKKPRLVVSWTVTAIDLGEAARALALLWTELDNRWYVPRWASARAYVKTGTTYAFSRTATNHYVGGKVLIWRDSQTYDVMTTDAIDPGAVPGLQLSGATTFDHSLIGNISVPLMIGSFSPDRTVERAALTARFEVQFTIDVTEYTQLQIGEGIAPQSYRGFEILNEVYSVHPLSEKHALRSAVSGGDGSTKFVMRPLDDHLTTSMGMQRLAHDRNDLAEVKQFIQRCKGRYTPLWVVAPPEGAVAATAASGQPIFIIKDANLANYYVGDPARKNIAFMVGGVLYPARVAALAPSGTGVQVTLETNLPVALPAGTLISFLRFARLASDTVELVTYPGATAGEVVLEFVELPAETP